MQLHPPALQRRHQRLDGLRLTHQRVPQQKAHGCTHHQHHEGTQRTRAVLHLVVQVEQRRHPAEQHEHFVQVADRNVADAGADVVAFVPAYHGADQRHADRRPGDARTQHFHGVAAVGVHAIGLDLAGKHADPVEDRADEEQHAHPQDGRLAREEILQQEHAVGALQVAVVERDRQQRKRRHHQHQDSRRAPEPSQPDQHGDGTDQDALLVTVHGVVVLQEGKDATGNHHQRKQPVEPVATAEVAFVQRDGDRSADGRLRARAQGGTHVIGLPAVCLEVLQIPCRCRYCDGCWTAPW